MLIQMRKNKLIKILLIVLLLFTGCSEAKPEEKPNNDKDVTESAGKDYETKFTLKGINYRLPVKYETLEKNGWEVNTDIDMEIGPNKFIGKKFLRNESYIIEVIFYNHTDESIPMKDALIAEIASENREFGGDVPSDLTIRSNINLNSTLEEVIAEYGEYTLQEGEVYDTYTFTHDKSAKLTLKYDPEEDYIRWLIITDFKE